MVSRVALASVLFRLFIVMVMLSMLMGNDAFLTDVHAASGATITVNSTTEMVSDDFKCGLREAITAANTNTASGATVGECIAGSSQGADTINFSISFGTIMLYSSLPQITDTLTIDGSGHAMTLHGQGLYQVFYVSSGVAFTVQGMTISYGYDALNGGGIYNDGTLIISKSTFIQNSAGDKGGGIYNNSGATLTVLNSTFSGNSAWNGGGIYSGGQMTITNSTLSGNNASNPSFGGGIVAVIADGSLININNTIIANSPSGIDCKIGYSWGSLGGNHNMISVAPLPDNACSDLAATYSNPSLAALANNGGDSQTFALLTSSPAINAGNDAVCAAMPINNESQNGLTRPQGTHCDIGSFELFPPPNVAPTDVSLSNNTVSENMLIGASVGNFSTTDPNGGDTHTYSFCGGTDDASFGIDNNNLYQAVSTFDFENKSSYSICVRTTDDGALSFDKTFGIIITNSNEPPVITSDGGGATTSRDVAENITVVSTVTASDPDALTILTYSLLGGADMAKFSINSSSGALTFLTAPDFESPTDVGGNNVYDVTVQVSDGALSDTQAIAVTVTNVVTEIVISGLRSAGAQDGWILETGESTNLGGSLSSSATTLRLGDDTARKQYRSILSFNTSSLPDTAVLTKVTLKLRRQGSVGVGNPLTIFQGFMLDIRKGTFGTASLQVADWQTTASRSYGPFTPALVSGWYSIDLTSARNYINKLVSGSGLTQIRLRFKLDDNNNGAANYLSLYSGNAGTASSPQLIIEYYMP